MEVTRKSFERRVLSDIAASIGDRVKMEMFLDRHKLTQKAAAEKLGISREHLNRIVRGRKKMSKPISLLMQHLDGEEHK